MDLILLRHGRAEERGTRQNDDERELTVYGKEKMFSISAGIKRLLRSYSTLEIWSSPLARARQTAEIVAQVLEIKQFAQHPAIHSGELDVLVAKWNSYTSDDGLLIIGHQPYLSEWSQEICGLTLPFKKGAAACIRLQQNIPPAGKLRWFLQPGDLNRLG